MKDSTGIAQRSGNSTGPDEMITKVAITIDGETFAQAVLEAIHGNPEESQE